MILTLILAAAAGWATRPAEPQVTEALLRLLGEEGLPDATGRRVAAFAAMLAVAAVFLALLDVEGHPLMLILGGALGYFQQEIREAILARRG
ncbi:hypothetical protein [Aestuariicoccus sp. MJ-SS9]|uniref:hypothetical protein n=1 Tax=Aestuariicoccus sp. MJ-SS9 TaxID=3079855 RepID=UPI0029067B81|nr:hypothetical protein [Aestuariicoccus sp. MJ-SS9]MDU8913336.1 hypothetical protein [Aestuariicoccus sp. MJ-SS9]